MRILLTGATGLLGRHLLPRLAARHEVVVICRAAGHASGGKAERVVWDLATPMPRSRLPAPIDAVIHLAQSPRYKDFPRGADDVFAVNVACTAALLDYAVEAGAERFLLASSGNVYAPYRGAMHEDVALCPDDFYGATKAAAETVMRAYGSLMATCALRLFFLYGPRQEDRLIPRLVERLRRHHPVTLAGPDDGQILTPTYADDVADVFATALDQGWSGTYNVAAPTAVSIRVLTEEIGHLLGERPRFERRGGESPPPIIPDLERLAARYDLRRFRPLADGLRQMLAADTAVGTRAAKTRKVEA